MIYLKKTPADVFVGGSFLGNWGMKLSDSEREITKKTSKKNSLILEKCNFYAIIALEKCKKIGLFILEKCILLGFCACI